jgi:CHAD domain-containing protein
MGKLGNIEWDEPGSASENAGRELPGLAVSYFSYVRNELAKNPEPARLHRLRLATKQLRYTLELFGPCYGPGLEARLDLLRKVQKRLGDANDCVAAGALLSKTMGRSPQRTRVEAFLEKRAGEHAARFKKEWQQLFEAPGHEKWWTGYLARPNRRKS